MDTRVYIIEDHQLIREMLKEYLALVPGMESCGMAETGEEAMEGLDEAKPDIILLDLSLPDRSGLDLLREITERWSIPCLIMSGHRERSYVERALEAGARGYILKGGSGEIAPAIERALRGETYLSPSLPDLGEGT